MALFNDILKATGNIGATDMTLTGSLSVEQAHTLIDAIKDNSGLLSKVTAIRTHSLNRDITAIDMGNDILVRIAEGSEPSAAQRQKLSMLGCTLRLLPLQLFGFIGDSALEDNQGNPRFEEETFNGFAKSFGNNIANLGLNGINDNNSAGFTSLNKGWVKLATDSADTAKVEYEAEDSQVDRLTAIVKAIPADALADSSILISPADLLSYNEELSKLNAAGYLVQGNGAQILGVPLEKNPFVAAGTYLATPLKNLVYGVGLGIKRNRIYDAEQRGLKYIFSIYNDYEILIKKWVVVGQAA